MKHVVQVNEVYAGAEGRESAFDLTVAQTEKSRGLVLFAHGYKGFKDWGAWHLVAREFSLAGFDFLKFNFSHAGATVEQPLDFPDTDAFAQNTYTKELEDVSRVLDRYMETHGDPTTGDRSAPPVYLIGHSRGGGIALLHAADDERIDKLATWAAVADFGERFAFDTAEWEAEGVAYVKNARTGQELPHNFTFYKDYVENRERLNLGTAARKLDIPWLIVHGLKDEAVSPHDADRLHVHAQDSELYFVRGAGHTFGASHPWAEDELPDPLQRVVNKTIQFFLG